MAAASLEAHMNTQNPADFSLIAGFDKSGKNVVWSVDIPKVLSFLYFFKFSGEVEGVNQVQARYETQYGPGDYRPLVALTYWVFRIMVGIGFLMVAVSAFALYLPWKKWPEKPTRWIKWLTIGITLPYLANTAGWLMTESARQPWIVTGLLKTEAGVSPLPASTILVSLIGFTLLYAALMVADVYLLVKYAKVGLGMADKETAPFAEEGDALLTG
jgi:cytochrome d ubiquinol oxidase subunit I